jgi:hypothetical protein
MIHRHRELVDKKPGDNHENDKIEPLSDASHNMQEERFPFYKVA